MSVHPIRPAMLAAIMDDPAAAGLPVPAKGRFNPAERGLWHGYVVGEVNRCPGCGRSHWWVRASTAECAFCSTALPVLN